MQMGYLFNICVLLVKTELYQSCMTTHQGLTLTLPMLRLLSSTSTLRLMRHFVLAKLATSSIKVNSCLGAFSPGVCEFVTMQLLNYIGAELGNGHINYQLEHFENELFFILLSSLILPISTPKCISEHIFSKKNLGMHMSPDFAPTFQILGAKSAPAWNVKVNPCNMPNTLIWYVVKVIG